MHQAQAGTGNKIDVRSLKADILSGIERNNQQAQLSGQQDQVTEPHRDDQAPE